MEMFILHMYFYSAGAIPKSRFENWTRDPSDEVYFQQAIEKNSFRAKNATERAHILEEYKKLMMYRNPVGRLVSGYFSKVDQHPLIGADPNKPERNWLRTAIYKLTHPREFYLWRRNGSKTPIHVEFQDYVTYWIQTSGIPYDEHFLPSIRLCSPCEVRYDYYGKFEDFTNESMIFTDMIRGKRSHIYSKTPRDKLERVALEAPSYYNKLSEEQKIAIIDLLSLDLGLYYALFPEERGSHKTIMGLDYDSAIPTI